MEGETFCTLFAVFGTVIITFILIAIENRKYKKEE